MKKIIFYIALLLVPFLSRSQEASLNSKVEIKHINDSVIIKVDGNSISLGEVNLLPIRNVRTKTKIDSVALLYFSNGDKAFAVLIDDPDFGNKSYLLIYRIVKNKIIKSYLYTGNKKNDSFESLTAFNNYVLIDSTNNIYYCSLQAVDEKSGKTHVDIGRYSWDTKNHRFYYVATKQYNHIDSKKILSDKW